MLAQLSVIPIGEGISLSTYVAKAVAIIKQSGLEHKVTDFGTEICGEYDKVMAVIGRCHKELKNDASRVYTTILIDDRTDKKYKIGDKIRSVRQKLGMPYK